MPILKFHFTMELFTTTFLLSFIEMQQFVTVPIRAFNQCSTASPIPVPPSLTTAPSSQPCPKLSSTGSE